jgi:hypothetical protein
VRVAWEIAVRHFAELGKAPFAYTEDIDLRSHFHEINRTARVELQSAAKLDGARRSADAHAPRPPEKKDRKRANGGERYKGLNQVPGVGRHAPPRYRIDGAPGGR